jgi:glutamate synthase domain-containing protein 3
MITLTLKEQPNVPLEAETLSPDITATLTHDAICALPVQLGKRQRRLDDFFTVEGEASDQITIKGDARKIKWIGRGMTRGRIQVEGHAGMHLGAYMKGGSIEVSGNVTDWIGAEMTGGMIRVRGNAGGQVGAAYRGSPAGMTDGTIIVHGSAGLEVGMRMKRGVIFIGGAVRDFYRPRRRRRVAYRRLDDARNDRLPQAAAAPTDVRLCGDLQPDVHPHTRENAAQRGGLTPVRRTGWRVRALHRRCERSRERRDSRLASSGQRDGLMTILRATSPPNSNSPA